MHSIQKPAKCQQTFSHVRGSARLSKRTPHDHDRGVEDPRCDSLQDEIGERLSASVAHKEDGQRGIVVMSLHFKLFLHAYEASIADVRAIQEAQEVNLEVNQ